MNLVADEGVERDIIEHLRAEGYRVTYVAELAPGITDDEVLEVANLDDALLITSDRDFGELVFRQRRVHGGVVLLRLSGVPAASKASIVSNALSEHLSEYRGAFAVVSPGAVRIRRRQA